MSSRARAHGLALAALLLASFPRPSAADTHRCFAEVELVPPRAVVGQQVLYRVRIFSRDDVSGVEWSHPPAFPNLRTETLPGDPQPRGAARAGFRVRDERRALFAERPGLLLLRAPELRCTGAEGEVLRTPVPESRLQVDPLPQPDRPQDFAGVVGPVALFVTVTPESVRLGESVRVAVMARGGGNLWSLPVPFAADAFGSAEVFAQRPELVLERGTGLSLRRHFAYDVVPHETGVLEVPALALPLFDPEAGAYRVERTQAISVRVAPRAAAPPDGPATVRRRTSPAPQAAARGWPGWGWLALPLAALALLALRRRRARVDPIRTAQSEARALEGAGDPDELAAALARALRVALRAHVGDAYSCAPEELMARPGLPSAVSAAAHLLASLERARFDPEAPTPDPAAVHRAIAEL